MHAGPREADVLECGLIIRRFGCLDGSLGRKFALQEPIQAVCLPRHLDVMGDVGLFANELVRLDDKVADVPAEASST